MRDKLRSGGGEGKGGKVVRRAAIQRYRVGRKRGKIRKRPRRGSQWQGRAQGSEETMMEGDDERETREE